MMAAVVAVAVPDARSVDLLPFAEVCMRFTDRAETSTPLLLRTDEMGGSLSAFSNEKECCRPLLATIIFLSSSPTIFVFNSLATDLTSSDTWWTFFFSAACVVAATAAVVIWW